MKLSKAIPLISLFIVLSSLSACGPKEDPLITRLGARSFQEREKASQEIFEKGIPFLPTLFKHQNHKDPEIKNRVNSLISRIYTHVSASQGETRKKLLAEMKKNHRDKFLAYLKKRLAALPIDRNQDIDKERAHILKTLLECDQENTLKMIFDGFKNGKSVISKREEVLIKKDFSIPRLIEILKDKNSKLREWAAETLGFIPTTAAEKALLDILKTPKLSNYVYELILDQLGQRIDTWKSILGDPDEPIEEKNKAKKQLQEMEDALRTFESEIKDIDLKDKAIKLLKKIKE